MHGNTVTLCPHWVVTLCPASTDIRVAWGMTTPLREKGILDIIGCIVLFSVFTISNILWGNTYKSNIQCIFLLQKKIVRIVYGANFKDHTDVIFQDLIFLKFYDLVKLKTCEGMYRAFNKTLPVNLNNIFTVCEPNCLFNMCTKKILYRNILGLT